MAAKKKTAKKKAPRKPTARGVSRPKKKGAAKKAGKKAPKKRNGRPPFVPTPEQKLQVKIMIGLGLTHREVASVIINPTTNKGISSDTLERYFREELDTGAAFVTSRVGQSLVRKAISDNHPQAAACAMFYLKCRAGWRQEDKLVHEVEGNTGVLVAPAAMSVEDWIAAAQKDNEGKEPPDMSGGGND